jgi:hypothetical protein
MAFANPPCNWQKLLARAQNATFKAKLHSATPHKVALPLLAKHMLLCISQSISCHKKTAIAWPCRLAKQSKLKSRLSGFTRLFGNKILPTNLGEP